MNERSVLRGRLRQWYRRIRCGQNDHDWRVHVKCSKPVYKCIHCQQETWEPESHGRIVD